MALEEAVRNALDGKLDRKNLEDSRFLITILSPFNHSFIEHNGEGKEMINDLVAIRSLDKELIRQKIELGKEYLFRVIDGDGYGVHKYYYAPSDDFENILHTIYTSSTVYSLLKIYDFDKDPQILKYISYCSEFILSMQDKDVDSPRRGAFYYSYYPDDKTREKKFVVGTTSKTIFTLLELYKRFGDDKYLESLMLGGDWLLTMQKPDGIMKSYVKYHNEEWVYSTKQSFLYNGQVLSAFSRLYNVTGERKYYDAAERIARHFAENIERQGAYLSDDYRIRSPISGSWAVLSLLDFYKISQDEYYKKMVFKCADELLEGQIDNENDIFRHGRWDRAYSTSGNGWLNEVFTEIYRFCREQDIDGCDKYKNAIVKVTRWLIQSTYSEENSFILKNPKMAIGGLFWGHNKRYVRTDSVCHGVNAYVNIIDDLESGVLLSIPEVQ